MTTLRYTLLTDGSSDRALLPILTWLLQQNGVRRAIEAAWADLGRLNPSPKRLPDRIRCSLAAFPCDLLFVHRDAEKESFESRKTEIVAAVQTIRQSAMTPTVPVIPDFINDFSPLRGLTAFQHLERDIKQVIEDRGWNA